MLFIFISWRQGGPAEQQQHRQAWNSAVSRRRMLLDPFSTSTNNVSKDTCRETLRKLYALMAHEAIRGSCRLCRCCPGLLVPHADRQMVKMNMCNATVVRQIPRLGQPQSESTRSPGRSLGTGSGHDSVLSVLSNIVQCNPLNLTAGRQLLTFAIEHTSTRNEF